MAKSQSDMTHSGQILVVEDNPTTAKTLTLFLNNAGYTVHCVGNGVDALNEFQKQTFDLILLDIMIPEIDGLTVCQKIRQQSSIPIVMLTAKSSEDDIVKGLEIGANDYVCKPFSSRELLARIQCCLRFKHFCNEPCSRLKLGDITLDSAMRQVWLHEEPIKLTKTEYAILHTLLQQVGRVFTREQLINIALGEHYDGYERTIDTHIWSLRKKLREPKGEPRYLHAEMGIGYRLQDMHEKDE